MEHFRHGIFCSESFAQMIFRTGQCPDEPVGQALSSRFPALLCRIQFRCVFREVFYAECFPVGTQKCIDLLSMMRGRIVNEKKDFAPALP